jgi:hypothetical protein
MACCATPDVGHPIEYRQLHPDPAKDTGIQVRGLETAPIDIRLQCEKRFCALNVIFKSYFTQLDKFPLFTGETSHKSEITFLAENSGAKKLYIVCAVFASIFPTVLNTIK